VNGPLVPVAMIGAAILGPLLWLAPVDVTPGPDDKPVVVADSGPRRMVIRADENNQCYITATVNGVRFRFLLDSGADRVFFTRADARRLGFDPARLTYDHTYSTWGGMVSGASVRLREVRIGGFIARNVVAAIDDTPDDMRLLGASMLKLLHFELVNGSCVLSW